MKFRKNGPKITDSGFANGLLSPFFGVEDFFGKGNFIRSSVYYSHDQLNFRDFL